MPDQIETHIYTLAFVAGAAPLGSPYAQVTDTLPFSVKKILFKPINCYFTSEVGGQEFKPFLVFCDLIDNTRPIGYSGHIASALPAVGGQQGQWVAVNNDVTFTLRNTLSIQGRIINFWLGSSLNAGATFQTVPFTGCVTVTVEYHSEI